MQRMAGGAADTPNWPMTRPTRGGKNAAPRRAPPMTSALAWAEIGSAAPSQTSVAEKIGAMANPVKAKAIGAVCIVLAIDKRVARQPIPASTRKAGFTRRPRPAAS